MEKSLMMRAIRNAAKRGVRFESVYLSHRDHNDIGGWEEVTGKFKGRIDVYAGFSMVHFFGADGADDYEVPMYLLTDESIERLYEQSELYNHVPLQAEM